VLLYQLNTKPTQESRTAPALAGGRGPQNRLWLFACVLMALVQIQWAGYQLGVGNQSIQAAFLQKLHDPSLFARDEMVNQTLSRYPSLFFAGVAQLLRAVEFEPLYLALHLLAAIGVFVAGAALARAMFRSHLAGLVFGAFLMAGHHHALAEQVLYSNGFTHTWAVFPVLMAVLALWYADRHWWAFALTGALANAHALEAGQLGIGLGLWALVSIRQLGWRKVAGLLLLMAVLALPAVLIMLRGQQNFDALWLELMRLRSALHSFPSTWWRAGNPDVPRFVLVIALAAVATSLAPPGAHTRKTLWFALATVLMFVAGWLFTELWPSAVFVRAQLFRSSRLLVVVAFAYIAVGSARAWRLPWEPGVPRWRAWLECAAASVTAATLVFEAALVLLPVAVAVAALVALLNRRLAWTQALLAGIALLVAVLAWRQIQFVLPGLSPSFTWHRALSWSGPGLAPGILLGVAGLIWWLATKPLTRRQAGLLSFALGAATIWLAALLGPGLLRDRQTEATWCDAQRWAREFTPADSLFLTPAQNSGFRILSGRSVVGEWRDGTQLYFSAGFTRTWWERMNALQPGMRLAPDKRRLLVRGKALSQLDDDALLALAQQCGATHIVVPVDETRRLALLYSNADWGIYRPQLAAAAVQQDAALARQARFIKDVALPGIEKNRKSDVRVQLLRADGRPVGTLPYRLAQTSSPFRFGVGWEAAADSNRLARVREVFNYTVLRDGVGWHEIETAPGQRALEALSAQLAACREANFTVEFSALAAAPPPWVQNLSPTNQAPRLVAHAKAVFKTAGDRVQYWQLTDQGELLEGVTNALPQLRAQVPAAKLGWSDAGRFWSPHDKERRQTDLCRGLAEARQLREQGTPVDFVALHARQPWGTWAEGQTIYEVLDAFAAEKLPVHITGFGVPASGAIEGHVRRGHWDPKLQAEYCRQFYTICFSHPGVAALNYRELSELLSSDGKPRPAFSALRELITKQWRTRQQGRLGLDGALALRAFHGEYELTVTLPGGKAAHTAFAVGPGAPTSLRLQLDEGTGKLVEVK